MPYDAGSSGGAPGNGFAGAGISASSREGGGGGGGAMVAVNLLPGPCGAGRGAGRSPSSRIGGTGTGTLRGFRADLLFPAGAGSAVIAVVAGGVLKDSEVSRELACRTVGEGNGCAGGLDPGVLRASTVFLVRFGVTSGFAFFVRAPVLAARAAGFAADLVLIADLAGAEPERDADLDFLVLSGFIFLTAERRVLHNAPSRYE